MEGLERPGAGHGQQLLVVLAAKAVREVEVLVYRALPCQAEVRVEEARLLALLPPLLALPEAQPKERCR